MWVIDLETVTQVGFRCYDNFNTGDMSLLLL